MNYVFSIVLFLLSISFAKADISSDYERALTAFNTEQFNESYVLLKNNLQVDSQHLPSKLLLGRIFLIDGFPNQAVTEFKDVLQAGGDINLVVIPLARAHMLKGEYNEVLSIDDNKTLNPRVSIELALIKADAMQRMGDIDEAIASLRYLLNTYPNNLGLLNSLTSFAIQQSQTVLAASYITQALLISSTNTTTLHNKGELKLLENNPQEAIALFKQSLELSPDSPRTMRSLAGALASIGQYQEAIRLVEKIESQTPGDLRNELTRARILALTSNKPEADKILSKLSERLSLLTDRQLNQQIQLSLIAGIVNYLNENYGLALQEFKRYLSKREATPEILGMLIESSIKEDFPNEAINIIENNQSIVEQDIRVVNLACDLYIISNRTFKCERLINNIPENQRNLPEAILIRSRILLNKGNVDLALQELERDLPNSNREDVMQFKTVALVQAERIQEAVEVARKLTRAYPNSIQHANLLADILLRLNNTDEAEIVISQLTTKAPDDITTKINHARLVYRKGNLEDALSIINEVTKNDSKNVTSLVLAAKINMQLEQLKDAEQGLLRAKALDNKSFEISELLINIYKQQNRHDVALSEINQLLTRNRLDERYLREKVNILIDLKRNEEAKGQIDVLTAIWADQPSRLMDLSQKRIEIKDLEGAEASLKNIISLTPSAEFPLINLISLYLLQENSEEALTYLTKLKTLAPNSANYHFLVGALSQQKKELNEAISAYIRAHSQDTNFVKPLISLYELAKNKSYTETILHYFQQIGAKSPENYFVRHLFADILFIGGNHADATKQYEIILEKSESPNKASIYNNMALINLNSDLQRALEYAEDAVELSPDSPAIIDTIGWIYALKEEPNKALSYLRRAYILKSDDPDINYHLAYTLHKLGRDDEAYTILKSNQPAGEALTLLKLLESSATS